MTLFGRIVIILCAIPLACMCTGMALVPEYSIVLRMFFLMIGLSLAMLPWLNYKNQRLRRTLAVILGLLLLLCLISMIIAPLISTSIDWGAYLTGVIPLLLLFGPLSFWLLRFAADPANFNERQAVETFEEMVHDFNAYHQIDNS